MTAHPKADLRSLTPVQVTELCASLGLSAARARQVFAWLYRPGTRDFTAGGTLRREVRELLARHAAIGSLEPARVERSRDGTVKLAFRLEDGAGIESVLIPGAGRTTLCVSSQAGCAMGCRYCLTGTRGLRRDLAPAEIVNQVLAAREFMIAAGERRPTHRQFIDNLVFMGMGEPLANYRNLLAALAILMDERGLGFTERRVTVSTCGLAPRIRDLGRDTRVNLAVSLHTVDDAVRTALMPVNRRHGVDELLDACRDFAAPGRRVIFFECVLLAGVNDAPGDARRLVERLRGIPARVNLLPYNEAPALPYRRSPAADVAAFRAILHRAGIRTLVRESRGADISAACGQLAAGS
jgi:23S rRNA (adenine2503-C2)-methyltransferase